MSRILRNSKGEVIAEYNDLPSPSMEWNYEPKPFPKKLSGCLQPAATLGFLTGILMFAFGSSDKETSEETRKWRPKSITKERKAYVERFSKVAQGEQEKFGIPASITLAQGILESNNGTSELATKNNNHFGVKCFSKNCKKGHCTNFTDDSHKDFFRKYSSAWESYREHSLKLTLPRYAPCRKCENPLDWAKQLEKCGYATDDKYSETLSTLIEDCDLTFFDK